MNIIRGVGEYFALDIGVSAIRVIQLSKGRKGKWTLRHFGYVPVNTRALEHEADGGKARLSEAIMTAIGQSGVKTRDVVIGLPSDKTFTTVVALPNLPDADLEAALKYQVDTYVPMNIEEAQIDYAHLGASLYDQTKREILIASTQKRFIEERVALVDGLGFNVVAAEPEPISIIRSLVSSTVSGARLLINMGEVSTDIVATYGDTPRLVRTIPTGLSVLVKAIATGLNVKENQARQFVLKFGLSRDKLNGQVYKAVDATLENFAGEVTKSVKFFQAKYPGVELRDAITAGYASVVPQFNTYIIDKTQLRVETSDPWNRIDVPQQYQQSLTPVAYEFAVAVGLAKRGVKNL